MKIVIKIGTSTLTHATGCLNVRLFESLCKVIGDIKAGGHQVILVSSGAISLGVGKLGLKRRPDDIPGKQAAAAVGQCELMYNYDKIFSEYNHTVAQILITADDVENAERREHFINTMTRLLECGALPIINENDTVATSELTVGDNDTLSAVVATSIGADLLVLLSDVDGLYSADPRKDGNAELIKTVKKVDEKIKALAGGAGTAMGTGGMWTKVLAAEKCASAGVETVIANGSSPQILYDIVEGAPVGTRFLRSVENDD